MNARLYGSVLLLFASSFSLPLAGQNFHVKQTVQLGGAGGWDYLVADSEGRRLYISHTSEVIVLDLNSNKIVGRIGGLSRIHGIALDREDGLGFISDGGANNVVTFKLGDLSIQKKTAAGKNPDAILYDSVSKHVFAFNGASDDVSVLDALRGSVEATVALGGKPEFAVADGQGHVFVNVEDKSEVIRMDSRSGAVQQRWPLKPCDSPSGLAIDRAGSRLFSVCDNEMMAIVDATTGKVLATPKIGKGPDAAAYDSDLKLAFASNGQDGTLTVVHQLNLADYKVEETVKTAAGARTMALDQTSHRIYLVTADFGEAPPATAEMPRPRKPIKQGSFRLLVVGQ